MRRSVTPQRKKTALARRALRASRRVAELAEALLDAAWTGDPEAARKALDAGAAADSRATGRSSAFAVFCRSGSVEGLALMSARLGRVQPKDLAEGLFFASSLDQGAIVSKLIEMGADPNQISAPPNDVYGARTPLSIAARYHCSEAVRALLEGGALPNAYPGDVWAPLSSALPMGNAGLCEEETAWTTLSLLLAAGADPNPVPFREQRSDGLPAGSIPSPLSAAAAAGWPLTIRMLAAAGSDLDARDAKGRTALHWAASTGRVESALVLMELGADFDACDDQGRTVHQAARDKATKNTLQAAILSRRETEVLRLATGPALMAKHHFRV